MFFINRNAKLLLALCVYLFLQPAVSLAVNDDKIAAALKEGIIAYDSKMYKFSISSFERAVELNRSNYEAMMYLARVHYKLKNYEKSTKSAINIVSSFYPSKELKIEAFKLLTEISNKDNKPWHALAYIYAASEISTTIDISHLVSEQLAKLDLKTLTYPEFENSKNGVITSKNLMYVDGDFVDVSAERKFDPVGFSVRKLNAKFIVLAGYDNRMRFNKLLVIKLQSGLQPKILNVPLEKRRAGGTLGGKDLYLKVMDWNFDSYPDLVVRVATRERKKKQAFLLYDAKLGSFVRNEELSQLDNPILDRGSKSVIEEGCKKGLGCSRKRYKLFNEKYTLAQFEKNICKETCVYTSSEIDVSSLRSNEHMYLISTIETAFDTIKSRLRSGSLNNKKAQTHTIVTKRTLFAYYSTNYDVDSKDKPIMTLDLEGSWEFSDSYVKSWVNNYFSAQPLNGQLSRPVKEAKQRVISN